ncbi:MAG: 8-amino-7-oxononanoate synthase [Ignavibacteriae bacterium]|nr:8-amino-7-oxononanoate synthase [Ignavibacteriota bacterium]
MDILDKCKNFTRAKEIMDAGMYPFFKSLSGNDGARVEMDGRSTIMIGSNNYLGLTHDPRVIEASKKATEKYGTSCSGSRFMNGTLDIHIELEEKLAKFMNKDAALIFSTGFMANLGAISALAGKDDYIIMDRACHASIYAGIQAATGANIKRYRHNDMNDLEQIISNIDKGKGKIIVSDGVFSMEGDIVNLKRMTEIANKYEARIYIDEAHGLGVLGKHGRGACEYLGLEDKVDIVMSTFSKSLGSIGGFVAGSEEVIHYIKHSARALIFTAAPMPAATAAALKSLEIIEEEPERMERLSHNSSFMHNSFKDMGFDIGQSNLTPIIPLFIRDDEKTLYFWKRLYDSGIFTNAILSPAVPPDQALIRTSYMSTHTDEDLKKSLEIFHKIGKELNII